MSMFCSNINKKPAFLHDAGFPLFHLYPPLYKIPLFAIFLPSHFLIKYKYITHTARASELLATITRDYGISVTDLKAWN